MQGVCSFQCREAKVMDEVETGVAVWGGGQKKLYRVLEMPVSLIAVLHEFSD